MIAVLFIIGLILFIIFFGIIGTALAALLGIGLVAVWMLGVAAYFVACFLFLWIGHAIKPDLIDSPFAAFAEGWERGKTRNPRARWN